MTAIDQTISINQTGVQPVQGRRVTPEEIYQGSESFYRHFIEVQEKILEFRYSEPARGGAPGTVNYDAMQDDPAYNQLQKTKEARTMFLAQQMTGDDTQQAAEASDSGDAAQAFLDYMAKSPAEQYYEMILKGKGLTKDQLAALPPAERARIERDIQQEIEHRIKLKAAETA